MPMLNVKVSGFPHPEISKKIAALTRGADCHHPRKAPRRDCVAIDYVHEDQWFVGGSTLSEQGKKSV